MKPWDEVIADPEFQKLPASQKAEAQRQYFTQVVAPQVPKDQHKEALAQFYQEFPEPVDPTEGMTNSALKNAGIGKAFVDIGRGTKQFALESLPALSRLYGVQQNRGLSSLITGKPNHLGQVVSDLRSQIDESKKRDAPLMNTAPGFIGNLEGNIAAVMPLSFMPGANSLLGSTAIGAGLGATQPVGTEDSRLSNTALGAASGGVGFGLGKGLGSGVNAAKQKLQSIQSKVAERAAAQAAADTASARSAAGTAAQDAYRQLEHLRNLKAEGNLTPEQAAVAAQLEQELAQKAQEKLLPAAARKQATKEAYQEALATETQRSSEIAKDKLSNAELKRQVAARLKRYGPAALGGVIGNMLIPGIGGGIAGAATGLVLRPALRSMINLSKNPAFQYRLLSPIAKAGMLANPLLPRTLGLLAPSIYTTEQ